MTLALDKASARHTKKVQILDLQKLTADMLLNKATDIKKMEAIKYRSLGPAGFAKNTFSVFCQTKTQP